MTDRQFDATNFIKQVDLLAAQVGIPRGALLLRAGANESAPYGWKTAASKPTVRHCVGLALAQAGDQGLPEQLRQARKWLQLAGRDPASWDDRALEEQLTTFRGRSSASNQALFDRYIRELRQRVKAGQLKPRFADAAEACWKAQQAVHGHLTEWLTGATARAVFHLHEWDDRLSPIMLPTSDLAADYALLLRQGADMPAGRSARLVLNLCVLTPRPHSDRLKAAKRDVQISRALQELAEYLRIEGIDGEVLSRFRLFKMHHPVVAERLGDVWMYESGGDESESYGVLLRSPAQLVRVFQQVNREMDHFDEIKAHVSVNPVELSREECENYLGRREVYRSTRDFELKLKVSGSSMAKAEAEDYRRWRESWRESVGLDDEDVVLNDASALAEIGWVESQWPTSDDEGQKRDVARKGRKS